MKTIFLIIAIILLTSNSFASPGIDVKEEIKEFKEIASTGKGVLESILSLFESIELLNDVVGAKALLGAYSLEEYAEPANPKTHIDEYFAFYEEELPSVENDVLQAWYYIKLAKEEKSLAKKSCKSITTFSKCILLTHNMVKHVIQANKEAASSAKSLFELVEKDLEWLEHAGANKFYYHGPAYKTYFNASKELKEKKKLSDFFEAMSTYSVMNEKKLTGKAKVIPLIPNTDNPIEKIVGIKPKVILEHPISYHEPYNKLIHYKKSSGMKEMLKFKQELVQARDPKIVYFDEWDKKTEDKIMRTEESIELLEKEQILSLTKKEIRLFSGKKLLQEYWYARTQITLANQQKENASWLKKNTHKQDFLALATRELQNSHAKASRAETSCEQILKELNAMENKSRNECWTSRLKNNNWATHLINNKIEGHCENGDEATTLSEAIKHYYKGIRAYQIAENPPDTIKTVEELEETIEKAGKDFDVSTEKKAVQKLRERLERTENMKTENALYELVQIEEKAGSIKEEIMRKAKIEYSDIAEMQLIEGKYPEGIENNIGRLKEIRENYEKKINSLPKNRVKLRYEFLNTPECDEKVETKFIIKLENPFKQKTRTEEKNISCIPAEIRMNNHSAYYEQKLYFEAPSLEPQSTETITLKGNTTPLECHYSGEKLEEKIADYSIHSKTISLNALTELPRAIIDFGEPVFESNGIINGNKIQLNHIEKGDHEVTVKVLRTNKSYLPPQNKTKDKKPEEKNPEVKPKKEEKQKKLDFSKAENILHELKQACNTTTELNVSVSVEFNENDLDYYKEKIFESATQEEINILEKELKSIWNKLMYNAKNEIEETEVLMKQKKDYKQISFLDKAKNEYKTKHFNKAFIYAYYAKSRTMITKKQETSLTTMNSLPFIGITIVLTVLVIHYRKKGKKTSIESLLKNI